MKINRFLFLFFILFFFSSVPYSAFAEGISTSPRDTKQYKTFVLANGMQVLLISDPETEKSAAALDVGVGSFADPNNWLGMAHFLEHMLFLGTAKYPDPDDYGKYLSEHGGMSNAYTSSENTNYHFSITPKYLEGALDRFSQFFIAPLFNEAFVNKEMKAVDSEHAKNLQSDYWRTNQVIKETANPKHPWSKFSTGNLQTLNKKDERTGEKAYQVVKRFYSAHYSANLMKLVILGKESLSTMEEWTRKYFSPIKNHRYSRPKYKVAPFDKHNLPSEVYILPIKDIRSLELMFPLPSQRTYFKEKPVAYLGHLIGHEGKGSLLSLLKEKGWVNTLSAGSGERINDVDAFSIRMELTKEGLQHNEEIVALVFREIDLIRKKGVQKWIFQELKKMAEINFQFKEKDDPYSYVRFLADALHDYPAEKVLTATWLYEKFDAKKIQTTLNFLRPDNLQIRLMAKSVVTNRIEPWYGAKYKMERISQKKIKVWRTGKTIKGLNIPKKNPFIPATLKIKTAKKPQKYPVLIRETMAQQVWFKQDATFNLPKADWIMVMTSPEAYVSPRNSVMTRMFTLLLQDTINEYSYPASLAGMHFGITNTVLGMDISAGGYDEKLPILLKKIFTEMRDLEIDKERFAIFKEQLKRRWRNFKLGMPYQQTNYATIYLLQHNLWHMDDYLAVIDHITRKDMQHFLPRLLSALHIEFFAHGNLTESEALSIVDQSLKILNSQPILPSQHPEQRTTLLTPGKEFAYQFPVKDPNSALELYYQDGPANIRTTVLTDLIQAILEKPFFAQLRTMEQLGYLVWTGVSDQEGIRGMVFMIQSSVKDPIYLESRVKAFLQQFESQLKDLPEQEWQNVKEALIAQKLEKATTLSEATGRFWNSIQNQEGDFEQYLKEVELLRQVSLKEIVEAYHNLFLSTEKRKILSIQAFGKNHPLHQPKGKQIKNRLHFKRTMPLYGEVHYKQTG